MPEAIPCAGRDQDELGVDVREEAGCAASVGAMMGCHESRRDRVLTRREQGILPTRLEIARKEYRGSAGRRRAHHETPIVEVSAPILDTRMEHGERETRTRKPIAPVEPQDRHPPRHRIGDQQPCDRIP